MSISPCHSVARAIAPIENKFEAKILFYPSLAQRFGNFSQAHLPKPWGHGVRLQRVRDMEEILQLRPMEQVRVDADQLSGLYANLGEMAAEDIVCRAMEELALRLSHCDRLFRNNDLAELRKSSRSLIAISDQIGMNKLARVAADVTECIDANDTIALAATFARLLRIGEGSLTAIWDLQDLTI